MKIEKDWIEYKKIQNGTPVYTNMVYVPLMNPEKTILCMDFDNSRISFDNNFFFSKELYYLNKFKNFSWVPNVLDIDIPNKKIFIEWNIHTCNNIIESGQLLNNSCSDWDQQILNIVEDIQKEKVYKLNLYTHCFFIDKFKKMKAIDFYACVDFDQYLIPMKVVEPIIGKKSIQRWAEAIEGDMVNFKQFYFNSISQHIEWPDNILRNWLNAKNTCKQSI